MAETTSGAIAETDLHDVENQETEIPGEPALPNETETCETEPPVIEGILPVPDEMEEPLPEIEGEILPIYEEEEVVLEGDIRFIEPESGGTP